VANQLAGELPPDGERRRLVLSVSKELETGARAMLLLAEGLFRLDVAVREDTIRTVVRNLSPGELQIETSPGTGGPIGIASEAAIDYAPGGSRLRFTLGTGADRIAAAVVIGLLRFAHRGTVQVTVQAIVSQAPE
jgi:hypothetical protein